MRNIRLITIALATLMAAPALRGQASAEADPLFARRLALVMGANNGGRGRVTLRYALDDARSVLSVLHDLGGVQPGDSVFLEEPGREAVFRELGNLRAKLDQLRPRFRRLEVVFYYSGHSDEENLLLGNEKVSYQEIREAITALNADVRIAVLDSCASGAFTQSKGVKKRAPFLVDSAYDMKGTAFMTSSSADEVSQESRRRRGSFFTHNLVSALRGAADLNLDGRITLTEAYQFAFDETLAQTEKTAGGPQHPNYNIQMSGTGDVIITDITKSAVLLTIRRDIGGRLFIHNNASTLVAEMSKPEGREITIGLEEGGYRITYIAGNGVYEADVELRKGASEEVGRKHFAQVDKIPTRSRGDRTYIPPFRPRSPSRWLATVFGGLTGTEPQDFNRRAEIDNNLIRLRDQFYTYFRQTGAISFYQANLGDNLRPLRVSLPWGIQVRYALSESLSLSLGLTGLWGQAVSDSRSTFTITEADGRQYISDYRIKDFTLAVRGWSPGVGLHAGWNLSRALRVEARVGGGPLFATCRYFVDVFEAPFSDLGFTLEEPNSGQLEERGNGVGWAADSGLAALWTLGRNWGIQLEAGYAFRRVDHLSGSGRNVSNTESMIWEGDWGMKTWIKDKPWTHIESEYPSNYWQDDQLLKRARDFRLDLSGFQLTVGVFIRL
jgi:Caspase domain